LISSLIVRKSLAGLTNPLINNYHQHEIAILVILLIISSCLGVSNIPLATIQSTEAGLLGLSFEELSRQAELIVLGVVLDEKLSEPGTVGAGLENHTISIEKVLKGKYNGSKVGVIAESQIMEDSPHFKIGEKAILFLYQNPPLFGDKPSGNDYTVVNSLQGKYDVNENGLTGGLVGGSDVFVNDITIADFEKKISNALSSPKTNITRLINNEAEFYYYRNDRDIQFNDSGLFPLTTTP
jgi:hypothetical protein